MKLVKKVLKGLGLLLLSLFVLITVGVTVRKNRKFEAPYPKIAASKDPQVIERGRYLVNGPGHCVSCHAERSLAEKHGQSREPFPDDPPLQGGFVIDIPPGKFYARNLTPDPETGIGNKTDAELARELRFGVRTDGTCLMPFMPFQNMSDADLTAMLSYLRSRPPVKNAVPVHEWSVIGNVVRAFLLKPEGPRATPPASVAEGPTTEYGKYLAESVANCVGCHTERDMKTGEFIGPPYAGGMAMPAFGDDKMEVVSQNLTPDPKTGKITSWSEDTFIAKFRTKSTVEGTHMPWMTFSKMKDDDLRAIYRYLRTVKPVERDPGPPLRPRAS